MMKRIFMLLSLALMVVAAMALSGVAQAASPTAKCQQAAASLGISGSYNFIAGNNKRADNFSSKGTVGSADVYCGFGGYDSISTLEAGDIFLGGAGNDTVQTTNRGTFYGGDDHDFVSVSNFGTFTGGAGDDWVDINEVGATYNGEAGDDYARDNQGTFNGGDGIDTVDNGNQPVDGPSGT